MAVVIRHADPTRSRGGVNLRGGITPGGLFPREQPIDDRADLGPRTVRRMGD